MISKCAICDDDIELNEICMQRLKSDPNAAFACNDCKDVKHNTLINNSLGNFRVKKYD